MNATSSRPVWRSLSISFSKRRRLGHLSYGAGPPSIDTSKLRPPEVYESQSLDPYLNLSYEDWLFRKTPADKPILLFYRNRPCVVIGRNQIPWKEANLALLEEQNIPLIRRRSGGGTVYHDLGNTNFSLMIPRTMFSRSFGADIIAIALRQGMGLGAAGVNDRGDLVIHGGDGFTRKMSSAYKIVQHRAYHHGTMLISSELDKLGAVLRSKTPQMETRGVDSVRSPVTTLRAADPAARHEAFVDAVTRSFGRAFGVDLHAQAQNEDAILGGDASRRAYVEKGVQEMKSWEWTYGQTPEFSIPFHGTLSRGGISLRIRSKHAVITHVEGSCDPEIQSLLMGRRYADMLSDSADVSTYSREVLTWLQGLMR